MIFNSIRWRLQAWLGLILTAVVAGFGFTAYQLEYAHRFGRIDRELQERISLLATTARPPAPPRGSAPSGVRAVDQAPPTEGDFRLPASVAALFGDGTTNSFYYIVWQAGGRVQRSTNAPVDITKPEGIRTDQAQLGQTRGMRRQMVHVTPAGRCILVGRSIAADLAELHCLAGWLALAGGAVLAFGLTGGWWMAGRALRPVEQISVAASRISVGNIAERINVTDTDSELGHLAEVLNSTFARLEAAFAQQKQFTADASHELRTPLTVIISETQTVLARERSAADYRETVEACLATAQQMRRLTESLLKLARLDAGQEPARREPLDLAEIARAGVAQIQPLAVARGFQIHCDLAPAKVSGDVGQLGQVITNLLTNAIQYNRPNGEVRVRTQTENGAALMTVADSGVGIAEEDLPHIFERFYRTDQSRATANGCSGLGLAISKAIVEAHGGGIQVSSQPDAGTTLTVRLPAG